jgi:hypothetical protein
MKSFQSIQEVLDYAIGQEQQAYEFYMGLARNARDIGLTRVLDEFAQEELGHKAKLESVKKGRVTLPSARRSARWVLPSSSPLLSRRPRWNTRTSSVGDAKEKYAYTLTRVWAIVAPTRPC